MPKHNISLITSASALLLMLTPAHAQEVTDEGMENAPSCEAMLMEIDAELDSIRAEQETRHQQMAIKARELPLLLQMHDGRFVYLGSYDGLGEPLESWFVSEEVTEKRLASSENARTYLESGDEASCLTALSQD